MTGRAEGKARQSYFRSSVFKRMFLSYALIILVLFGIFIGWTLLAYRRETTELAKQEWEQRAVTWGNWMDQQLMQAQILCGAVNASETARSALQTVYVEKKTMSALQLYNMLGELNRIKGSARSTCLNSLMLAFQGENKVFLPGAVYSVEGACRVLQTSPYFGLTTASGLLGVEGRQISMNKEYLIYGEAYTGFGSQSSMKGEVLVLLEQDQVRAALRERLGEEAGLQMLRRGQPLFATGSASGYEIQVKSLADSNLTYTLTIPDSAFSRPLPVAAIISMTVMALAGLGFVLLTYRISSRYYKPIDDIQRLVEAPERGEQAAEAAGGNEFDQILQGITGLIGERNGYLEKMVTITPYARQGMLQAVIQGAEHPGRLVEEQFTELKRNYYMVGKVNIALTRELASAERRYQDLQELILSVCRSWSGEEMQVVAVPENLQNIFVILASDEKSGFEDCFYRLYRALEENAGDENTVLTIGIGACESDLDRLSEACRDAQTSLEQMLTGGRGAVYFPEERAASAPGYYFPRDAQKQMVRLLKERNLAGLEALLEEIYQKNLIDADLPAAEVRQMLDELYWTIRKAVRNAYDLSTIHVRMEPIRDAATVEEIFAYYRQVFSACLEEAPSGDAEEKERSLEDEICQYLEEHLYDPELSLNSAAAQFGVSTKMIGLICRKKYNQTFLNYVRDRQIQRAEELLRDTELSLEEIARQCGFTNILTFRRNFRAVTGVNPSEYRGT